MRKTIIVLWILTLIIIIFVSFSQRYQISAGGSFAFAYKIDKLTGKVWYITPEEIKTVQESLAKKGERIKNGD